MEIISNSSSCGKQKAAKLAVVADVRDALLGPYPEPDDSGIDSDDPSPAALQPNAECSTCSDEEYSDTPCPVHDMNTPPVAGEDAAPTDRDSLDIFIQWRPGQGPEGRESPDRSSPPLYEVELTASDEDDDTSVLELVIPMQSRYQRVPTSSPKKTKKKKVSLWAKLFCCVRK